jgi:hypothetical protein
MRDGRFRRVEQPGADPAPAEGGPHAVCYAVLDEDRSTEFVGKSAGKALLLTYRRVKK